MRFPASRHILICAIACIAACAFQTQAQTYRYLKIWVNNTNSDIDQHTFGVVETEWYVGDIGFPVTKMTSDDGPAPMKCWFERNGQKDDPAPGYWTYRMYDGEIGDTSQYSVPYKSQYATIGFEPYPFAWVLDLGEGNGIGPDSVWIRGLHDPRREITELKCFGSNDNENWVLIGETDNPSHVQNCLSLFNTGGGKALTLLGPGASSHLYVGEVMKWMWHYNPDSISGNLEFSISTDGGGSWIALPDQPNKDDMMYEWVIPTEINGESMVSPTVAVSVMEAGNEASRQVVSGINISPLGTKPFVIDNGDPGGLVEVEGDWVASSATEGFEGINYIHDGGQLKDGKKVHYKPTIQVAGMYALYGKWTSHHNRAPAAPYIVQTPNGPVTATADQRLNGGEWVLLDTFALAASEGQTVVTISAEGTADGEIVIADAIKFVYVDELSAVAVSPAFTHGRPGLASRRFIAARTTDAIRVPAGAARIDIVNLQGRTLASFAVADMDNASRFVLPESLKAAGIIGVAFY